MFAKKCFDIASIYVSAMTNGRCDVEKVEVWEHESNSATYTNKHVQTMTFKEDVVKENTPQPEPEPEEPEPVKHTEPGKDPNNPYAAAVGPTRKTHDLSNPFGGTSWGASQGDSMRR